MDPSQPFPSLQGFAFLRMGPSSAWGCYLNYGLLLKAKKLQKHFLPSPFYKISCGINCSFYCIKYQTLDNFSRLVTKSQTFDFLKWIYYAKSCMWEWRHQQPALFPPFLFLNHAWLANFKWQLSWCHLVTDLSDIFH